MRRAGLTLLLVAACGRGHTDQPVPLSALASARAYLDSAVATGAAPGAVLGVSIRGQHLYHATGVLGAGMPARPDSSTVYDLASLTKVVGLTTAVMLAVDADRLDLDAPATKYVPAFRGGGREAVTIRHLLTHTSGLPAFRLLYRETADRTSALALAPTTARDTRPRARVV